MVGADTKSYLYLDPSRLLGRAPSLWDPNVGMGTVTHQNIGYLLPMGPYYWLCHAGGLPMWVSQRLWTASLLFLAGLGVVYLLRTLGWSGRAVLVAALAYALTPYVLEYEARISAILMPWSAMPWMVALVARGLRRGGWRHPAAFALVVAVCGGVNATSLIYAGVAPLLWIPMAIWITGEASVGRAVGTVLRVGALTVLTSLWWMAGLVTQAGYGLDVLRYTETVQVVAATSLPIEVLRSLGNWYFYGRDAIAAWIQPAVGYTRQIGLLTVSYLLPWLAVVGAAALRWRHKLYFVALVVVGVVLGVGVYPYNHPSPVGAVFKAFATGSSAGLALRSVGRAAPLVALGVAVLLGAGIDALSSRLSASRLSLVTALVGLLVLVNMAPLFTGQFVDNNLQRPEQLPSWWVQAAAAVNQARGSTRVLELPGADFSHYRWGTTLDPVTPGIMDRPFVSRELIPYGSAPSADLLRALDRRMQEGTFEPASLGPLARLMSVGDVVLRSDLQYERFLTPRPRPTWQQFSPPPPGLSNPTTFGPPVTRATLVPLVDEANLATPSTAADPPPVAVFGVPGALPIVRTETTAAPVVLAGDGEGVVDAAAGGVLGGSGTGPVLYAADLGSSARQQALADGAELVLTDTNRRRAQRWGTIQDVNGYTEQAGEQPLVTDLTDNRLPLFPGATDAAFTVAQQRGVVAVRATHYGNPVSYEPWYRPALALDGDPTTAWEVGAFSDPVGERLQIDVTGPVTSDHVTIVQPLVGARERWITRATLTFDGGAAVAVNLGDASRMATGQTVTFPSRTFHRLDITVDAINFGRRADFSGGSGVGFSEVQIPGVHVDEYVRLPTDLLANAGTASADHRLVVVLTRKRSDPLSSFKSDEELALKRTFTLPTARSFDIDGPARLSATATDDALDALVRGAPATGGGMVVRASSSMAGSLTARPVYALDGQAATAWTPDLRQPVVGQWIEAALPSPVTLDHLDLTLIADGRHSVPTRIGVTIDGHTQEVAVPPIADGRAEGATVTVRVLLAPQAGSRVRLTVLALREVKAVNYFSKVPQILPVSVAELGIPGVTAPAPQTTLDSTCRTGLLQVDGHPVGLRITGPVADAVARQPLSVALCDPGSLTLGAGSHDLLATPGRTTGIDLDRLILSSAPAPTAPAPAASPTSPAPAIRTLSQGRTHLRLQVARSSSSFWLVLGESRNSGWTATIAGGHALGASRTVDGYANGWLVRPTDLVPGSGPVTVTLDWTPQHKVWIALGLSALGIILCLALLVLTRGPVQDAAHDDHAQLAAPWSAAGPLLSRRARVVTVLISGLAAAGVIAPVAGLLVGLVVAIALWRPGGRALLSLGTAAAIGVSALYVLELQIRYRFPSKLDWPQHFAKVVGLTWIGVALFAVDAVVQWLRDRQVASRRE